jgi:hypothetical protein
MKESLESFLFKIERGRMDKKFLTQPKSRRVKSYPIFKLVTFKGFLIKLFKRVTLKDFKKHYNIDKTNRVVGWTPDYLGATRSKYIHKPNLLKLDVFESVHKTDKFSKDYIKDVSKSIIDHRVVYSAGFDTVHDHISTMMGNNTTSISVAEIFDILSYSDFKWFVSPKVSFNDINEIDTLIRVNNNAFSGHYTNLITHGNKGSVDLISRQIAKKIYNILKIKPQKNLYLWSILGREKDIKVNYTDKVKEVGTRAVWCCESAPTTLLMWFAQKMAFSVNKGEWVKTYNILDEFTYDKASKLIEKSSHYDYCLEADWSKFDSNIDTNFLIAASHIITSGLNLDDRLHRNIAYYITKSIVTKYVTIPPGVVIEVNRGQPSGHPFGTFINCNVNLIYWSLIGFRIYGKDYASKMSVEVYGDDTFAFFKESPNLRFIDKYISEFGLKSEKLSDKFTRIGLHLELCERPDFLKRRFNETEIVWNHKKMCDRLLYQTRNRNITEQVNLIKGYVETCPNDLDVVQLISLVYNRISKDKSLFKQIEGNKLKEEILKNDITSSEIIKKAKVRSSSIFRKIDSIDSFKQEMSIMNWSSCRFKGNTSAYDLVNGVNRKYQEILFLIGFNISEFKRLDEEIVILGNKSPPAITEDQVLQNVKDHFVFANMKMENYLNRRFRK